MKPARVALLFLLLLPATAAAEPAIGPLKPCYLFDEIDGATGNTISEQIDLTGSGFTPGARIALAIDGNSAGETTADPAGAIATTLYAPIQEKGERDFTITATDPQQASVSVTSKVSKIGVTASPKTAKATQTVTFTGRGFTVPGAPVYAHYVHRGRDRKTVRVAAPTGPCGTFAVRRRQFPIRRPAAGEWTIRFDQDKRFRARARTPHWDLTSLVKYRRTRST
jgi:hypothetical protein